MPHRVTTFLRNSSTSIEAQVASIKKATVRRPSPKPQTSSTSTTAASARTRQRPQQRQRPESYASSLGDDAGYSSPHEGAVHDIAPSRTSQSSTSSRTAAPAAAAAAASSAPAPAPVPTSASASASAPAPASAPTPAPAAPAHAATMPTPSSSVVPSMKSVASQQRTSSAERREKDHHHHHRLSFGALHFGRSSRESHSNPNLKIDWKIESPPIVLYNDAETSTGALVSGLLFLHVKDEPVKLESFVATLHMHVTQKRPYTSHCADCTHQYTELRRWTFLQGPKTLTKGEHGFPFSVLLKGNLPASMDGQLVSIAYEFAAEATPVPGTGLPVKLDKLFNVLRSLPAPELPHHSVRIFPPTNIKASVHFPQVIYPIGQYTFSLRMDGVARLNEKANTVEYWKLKKLTWRLEESTKAIAPACTRHAPRDVSGNPNSSSNLSLSSSEGEATAQAPAPTATAAATAAATAPAATASPALAPAAAPAAAAATAAASNGTAPTVAAAAAPVGTPAESSAADINDINNINNPPAVDPGVAAHEANAAAAVAAAAANAAAVSKRQAVQRKDTRMIGEKTLVTGWKSNYAGPDDSLVEIELEFALNRQARFSCDTKTRDGTEVTHQLMVEMVVSQEWAPVNKPSLVTQTGVGRILRMHFNVVLTERGGIGISWDNEAPPIYQDVPPSPPSYLEEIGAVPDIEPLDGVISHA